MAIRTHQRRRRGQWTYASRVTFSFMPDGISIGCAPSRPFQALNAIASRRPALILLACINIVSALGQSNSRTFSRVNSALGS